jgi:hypothetical protein
MRDGRESRLAASEGLGLPEGSARRVGNSATARLHFLTFDGRAIYKIVGCYLRLRPLRRLPSSGPTTGPAFSFCCSLIIVRRAGVEQALERSYRH